MNIQCLPIPNIIKPPNAIKYIQSTTCTDQTDVDMTREVVTCLVMFLSVQRLKVSRCHLKVPRPWKTSKVLCLPSLPAHSAASFTNMLHIAMWNTTTTVCNMDTCVQYLRQWTELHLTTSLLQQLRTSSRHIPAENYHYLADIINGYYCCARAVLLTWYAHRRSGLVPWLRQAAVSAPVPAVHC